MSLHIIDGNQSISTLNYSLNYGVCAWEGIRTYWGKPLFLKAHIERLYRNVEELKILNYDFDLLRDETRIRQFIEAHHITITFGNFGYLRPIIYTDVTEKTLPKDGFPAKLDIHYMPVQSTLNGLSKFINMGFNFSKDFIRNRNHDKFLKISPNYWRVDRAKYLLPIEVDEVLFHDGRYVIEGGFSTLFAVDKSGQILTPELSANFLLEGITRKWILDEFKVKQIRGFPLNMGYFEDNITELFIAGTHAEIKSVKNLWYANENIQAAAKIGNGTTPIADDIRERYFDYIRKVCK